ncbi:MAG: S26 family signal peptidase [Nitrospira sp.]|nr:S26 family signal peptidase [Nitrospira sp.]
MIVTLTPRTAARFAGSALPENCQGPALQHLQIPRVASWSMYPTLCKGDRLELGPAEPLHVGDLVVFRKPFGLVCHRLVARQAQVLFTKGDANSGAPEPVMLRDVLGIVVAVVRGSTRVITADLATLAPPPPWRRIIDHLSVITLDRSRQGVHRLIRLALQSSWLGGYLAGRMVRWATIECVTASPVQSFHEALVPTPTAPPIHQNGRPDPLMILGIRLGPVWLGTFHQPTERLDIRPILAGTRLEFTLREALRHQWGS